MVGKGRLVPTILPRSLAGFVTDITITNDVTFDFNSSKKEKEIIVITVGWQGREPSALLFLTSLRLAGRGARGRLHRGRHLLPDQAGKR